LVNSACDWPIVENLELSDNQQPGYSKINVLN